MMNKVCVVYWSGTGNTQAMAEAVAKAAEARLIPSADFSADQVAEYDAIAFGCPAMGAEVLEACSTPASPRCPARRSRCSAPTAGATANGCAAGRTTAVPPERFWPATA